HLAAMQPVGTAHVRLPRLLGERLRLALAPLEAEAPSHRDRVDEDRLVAVEHGPLAEARRDRVEVRLAVGLVVTKAGVRPADEDGEVPALGPGARADGVARPALDGEVAGLEVHEQGRGGIERPQEAGLADARLAEDAALDAARLGEALIGRDDGQAHRSPPCAAISASIAVSAPRAPALRALS